MAGHGTLTGARAEAEAWVARAKDALLRLPDHPLRGTLADLAGGVMRRLPQVLVNVRVADPKRVAADHTIAEAVRAVEARLAGEGRVLLRPSGTEPKIKVYIDAQSTEGTAEERKNAAKAVVTELSVNVHRLVQA